MSDSVEDAKDFVELTESRSKTISRLDAIFGKSTQPSLSIPSDEEDNESSPGTPVQYQLYRNGYSPTNQTVKKLPSGCYEITADNNCVYVYPAPKPTGLLLELPEMRSEEVINVIENFWNSEKDYKEGNEFVVGGAAFKAGIMLYGPPGSGKTSVIKIVSNKLIERGGTVFYASGNPNLIMGFLENFSQIETNRKCVVVLEDIDSLIMNWGESIYLAMLDSAKSIDNVLFIATTNYPDRLDPRIYNRPGRFSHVIKVGLPTEKAREAYLKAILKDHRDVEYIVKHTDNFSVDHLTALVNSTYREKKDLKNEITRLRTLFKVPKSEEDKTMGIGSDI